jgi:hypothetical protein
MLIICCEVFVFLDSILQNIILEVKKTLSHLGIFVHCTVYNVCSCVNVYLLLIRSYKTNIYLLFVFTTSKWILSRDEYFSDGLNNQISTFCNSADGFTTFVCLFVEKMINACFSEITY